MKMRRRTRKVVSEIAATIIIILVTIPLYFGARENKAAPFEIQTKSAGSIELNHEGYNISEDNPWQEHKLSPIEYTDLKSGYSDAVDADCAIVVDVNDLGIVYGKNINKQMAPASTTKLMTVVTALDYLKLSDVVTTGDEISEIAGDSSTAGFAVGQTLTVKELVQGLMVSSGNDAAYVLAKNAGKKMLLDDIANEGKNYSTDDYINRFIEEMNKNAADMKLENTHFCSPDGYDTEGQYTCAADLSKIAIKAYSIDIVKEVSSSHTIDSKTLGKTWINTNELLNPNGQFYYENCKGIKTGSTDWAGKCLVAAGVKGDRTCISVVLHDLTDEQRWNDTKKLLDFALNR